MVIGKTPLDLDQQNDPDLFKVSQQVQFTKEGHTPISVVVPRLPNGGVGRINANLQASVLPKVCQSQSDSINALAKENASKTRRSS